MNRVIGIISALSCLLNVIRVPAQDGTPAPAAAVAQTATPTTALPASSTPKESAENPEKPGAASAVKTASVPTAKPEAAAAGHPVANARNIRFQFDGIPYMDVLERFAQMANKPLVADTNVQGNLTFNDPTPYTYQEALDTLNLMLSMKDMSLVDSEHYLRLVPLKQLSQLPLPILRGLDKTGDVRPGEVVTVVLHVKNLDAKETAEAVTSMLSNAGSVAPMGHGHGVIVTDRLANIQRIQSLLNLIDTETVAERQMKAFTLLHASGAVVADLINRTFGVATAPKRTQFNAQSKQLDTLPADPNDYVTAVYDDASRTLVLFGPRERVALAEELISKFEDKEDGGAGDVRIYFPQVNKAEELAQMIRQAIPGVAAANETATTAATKARLIVDSVQNRLIVAAPIAGQLDSIENLINKVDKPVHGTGASGLRAQTVQITRVFRPRSADAASLSKILTEALTKRTPGGVKISTANVTVEPTSQSVVVTGSPGDVQLAVDVITQLENGSGLPMPQQTKFIDVGTVAEAKRLLPLIEQIYRSQLNDGLGGQTAHAKILADEESGRLIVTASEEHVRKIEEIVKQLKAEKAQPRNRRLQILTLAHLRIDAGFNSISNLVAERMSDKRFEDSPKPLLLPDVANNRLLVTASDDQFREVEQVVKTLDIGPEKGQRQMRVIPLQSKSASDLIALSTQLMNQLGDAQSNPQLAPKLIPDASGRQIIVLATPEDMARVTNLVAQLDGGATTPRQMRAVELFSRSATDFTPLVQQLYQEQLKNQAEPAGGPATLLPEAKNNRIMVSGSEKEIARVEAIVRQLDPEGKKGAKDETRVIRLKTAVAGDLAGLVEKSLTAQAQQVKVLVDARSNSLVVTGEAGAVEAASQIIQQLDTQSDVQPRELRLIELKSAEATAVAPMVTSLFTDIIRDQRGPEYKPQAKIIPDSTGNRLIVTGSKDELRTVAGLVEQLDQMPEAAGSSRVFKLTTADASSLVTVVSNAMVRFDARNRPIRVVSVSADEKSNSLIVSGSRADLQDAQAIIERLDGEGVEKGRSLKVIEVVTDDPDALAALATKVFASQNPGRNVNAVVSITPEPSGKRLIILAPPSLLGQVETVIQTLDAKPEQGARELQTVELKAANAQKVLPTVRRIYGEQTQGKSVKPATIYPDSSGTRLLVYGTKDQGAAVRQIVDTMVSSTPAAARETRSFDVGRPDDVQRLLPLVQQLYQEQWKEKGDSDPADAQILSDARTGRLIVTGKPEHLKQIEVILKQLNAGKPRADARETRIFDLTTANAADLAGTVRTLYLEEAKSRMGTLTPDVLILPDASANRLIVTGDSEEVQSVEDVIKKLDKVTAQSGTVRVFKLKFAEPAKVLEILTNALTSYDSYGRSRRRVGVTLDAKTRTIIVAGDPKELQSLQNAAIIIEQLDNALGQQAERKIRVFTLKQAKVADLSPKARQLYNDQLASKPDLGATDVLILDDAPGNQIIAAGSEAQLALLEQIINQLQAAQIQRGQRETKLIEIGQADEVDRLLPLVQQLYREHWRDKAAGDPADAQIVPDSRNARLIVTARTNQIAEIESIISQLRAGTTDAQARETRVYELTSTAASDLASTVKSLYQEAIKSRPTAPGSPALVLPDANANRLIVSATTNDLALIDGIIQKLDKTEAQTGRTRVFKLKSSEAQQVATLLSTALVQISPTGRSTPRVSVGVDVQNNLLIVSGAPQDLQSAAIIVEQMDQMLAKEPRQLRVVALQSGLASEVATRVKQLYQDQLKGQPKTGPADALVMGDDVSSRLIITASDSHMKLIEEIVAKLQETGAGSGRQLRVLNLQRNSAASVAAMLSQLFARQISTQDPSQHLGVSASGDDRTLVLDAAVPVLEKVEQLVKALDGEEALGKVDVRTYQLPEGNATELAPTLARLFTERAGQSTPSGLTPRFEADATANVLIVAATQDQFLQIEKLVEELKKTAQVSNEIRTFKLQNGDPTQIAEVLQTMLTDTDPSQPGQQRPRRFQARPGAGVTPVADVKLVRVAPARSLNAVVVQGPPEKLALAEKLIQALDKDEIDGRTVIESVRLKKAHAENLAEAVSKTIATRGGAQTRLQRVSVTPVIGPNSLLLNGPSDAVKEVIQVIHDLDQESEDEEIKVHIYKLENGTAREVSAVIQQLLQNVTRSQTRARPTGSTTTGSRFIQPSVSVDERSNSLIISGTPAHFKMVEQLLSTLDKVPEHSERDVQFVWLRNAKAFDIASKVEGVFAGRPEAERPVIDADIFNNSITVIGKRADIVQVQDLISRLDASSRDTSMQVRLRPLDRVPVEQMARMLQNIYPQMSSGAIKVVEKIQPPAHPEKTSAAPSESKENAPAAPARPNEEKKEETEHSPAEVVVAIDKNANALILSGPTHELDQIDRIISELSFSYISSDAEFRVFPLKEADPVIVARTLTELFRPEPVQVQPQGQQQGGQQQRPGEVRVIAQTPKVTAVAEPRTRSVIVRAKPTDFTLMESLIKQLDVAGVSSQLEFRVVSLTNAPPQKVAPLIQQLVAQMNIIRPGEPLSVSPDPRSHGLLVVARDALLRQVESMIHSLDTPSPYEEAEVLVLSLKKANASQLAAILQSMLKPGTQGEATPEARELQEQIRRLKVKNQDGKEVVLDLAKPIRIMGDPLAGGQGGGNRLILSSTPDNLKALAAVVEMMDAVPVSEGVNVKLIHLQFADAATVSQTLTTIFSQGQRLGTGPGGKAEPEGSTGKALVNPLNVAIDSRSNSLILSGQKESLDLAQKVVSDLDRKIERFITEVRLFRLKHASARRMAPLLQAVFAEGPPVPGSEGLATQVTRLRAVLPEENTPTTEQPKARAALVIQADDTTNLLIVAARADTLPLIEAVINQLDIPSASGMDNLRVYALDHADPTVIQKIIMDLHSGPRASQLRIEDIPNVTIDERTQSLIVSGNQKAFAFIDGLIARLDKELPLELRDVRIIPLENADSGTVAASLQRLLDARVAQKTALGKQEAEALRVMVIGEPRSNSLLVAGSKDSFELVESLARELDAAPPALSGRIRLVPLRYADARALSASLINLFNQRYQAARSPETQRNRPVIVADPRSNSLMIAAGVDDNQAIDDLVSRLDQHLEDPSMVLTVIGLRHNNSATVATTLESIFAARLRSRTVPGQPASPQDSIKIEPDSLNNSLIISASRENLELIAGLLEKIDVEPVVAEGVVQTFTLEFADAQRVANMLRSLVQQGLYRPGKAGAAAGEGPREAMAITVDGRSNTLVVSASPENLMVIKEVIRQIDTKDFALSGNIRLYTLKHARASSLATVLEQFFRARRAGEASSNAAERSIPVTVVPDDRANVLLVTGGKESFDVVDRMIEQLDGDDVQARMGFRVFILKQATAAKLQSTLQRLFANRPSRIKGEPSEPITVVADSWVNALIVGASIDDMSMVATLIERLDSDQSQLGVTVQVFPLAKADARRVAQVVQGLYREGGPGGTFPVAVTADERMNAIVVSAGESDLKRIGDLVKKLDTDQVGRVAEIRIFPLQHARADSISTILSAALNSHPTVTADQSPNAASLLQFITRSSDGKELVASALKEGVLITPDVRMNSLVVSAPVDYMNLLEQIINRLDSSAPQQAKIKVFPLVNADARMMAELLMTMFRLQPSGVPIGAQRAIQYTLVRDKQQAGGLPEDDPSAKDEVDVASATLGTDDQGALHVTVDQRTNSLLVGGTDQYVALVSEIIQSLDSSEAQERKSKVYPLKNAQASDIATAIRTFLDQDRQRITQVLGQEAVGTAQRLLEREVGIVAETNSNTLLLSASPRYFKQVEDLIVSLDQPRPQVLIQVLLAEVTLDSTQDLGVEWNITKTVENAKLATGTDFGVLSDLKNFGGFSSAVTGGDYNFLIRALQNDGRLEVLSRPQILTADNKPATINVGQRVPLINNSTVTPQGGSYSGINYESVGVNLQVTPRIGSDGAVRMEISTTNSALSSSTVDVPSGSGTVPIPIINERRASTFVSVQSGQTILIGGLIETSEDNRVKKVPYLGDIPGLGVLFRSKTKTSNRKELLILLTPQVLLVGTEKAQVEDVREMTREQLERSTLRDQIQHDKLRDQLLEPLYPKGIKGPGKLPTPNNPSGLNSK